MLCFTIFSCGENKIDSSTQNKKISIKEDDKNLDNKQENKSKFTLADFYSEKIELTKKVEEVFISMTDDERVAQMIITSTGNNGKPSEYVENLIRNKKVGGIVFLGGTKEKFESLISEFTKINKEKSKLPLIYSTDAEPSLINMKISGIDIFKPTNTISTQKASEEAAEKISKILQKIGFDQNFAPVCDNNANKEIIGNRSFGSNPEDIIKLSNSFIEKTQSNNIIATAKHFPGHGNVKGDSHKSLVSINGELKELGVYKNLISNKNTVAIPISIMVGHIAIKNNEEYDTYNYPATLSKKIVTGLLKNKLQFKGIIITDGMNMGALNTFTNPSLKAVEAGCDMILMPSDEEQLLNSILLKLNKEPDFKNQIYDSVKKIIRVKVCLGTI